MGSSPLYETLEIEWKYTYIILVSIGMLGWMGMAAYQSAKYHHYYLHDSVTKSNFWNRWMHYGSLYLVYLFNMPTYLLILGRRFVKLASVQDGPHQNHVFVLAYEDDDDWMTKQYFGLQSHIPAFIFEDIPSIVLNIFFIIK